VIRVELSSMTDGTVLTESCKSDCEYIYGSVHIFIRRAQFLLFEPFFFFY
jgi:hypothetical protein